GRAALADARTRPPGERVALLATARRAVLKLERERSPWASALAQSLRGQLAVLLERPDEALGAFARATDALTAVELYLDAACARRAHGLLLGGQAGRVHVAEAEQWMASERIGAIEP